MGHKENTCTAKPGFTCPYDAAFWICGMAGEIARDNCPLGLYESKSDGRQRNDLCYWLPDGRRKD